MLPKAARATGVIAALGAPASTRVTASRGDQAVAGETRRPAQWPISSCVEFFEILPPNLDLAFVLSSRCQVIGKLHAQPRFRRAAERLGEPDRHLPD